MTRRQRTATVHPTAELIGAVEIACGAYIGPFCVVGFPTDESMLRESPDLTKKNSRRSKGAKVGANSTLLSHVVIGEGTVLGSDVWCDHHCFIGGETVIADEAEIMYGARVYNRVRIGRQAWVAGFVCDDAIVEPRAVMLGTLIHRFVDAAVDEPEEAPVVREGAFVGMNATVVGGIEVGPGAYVAAGAVLTKSAKAGRLYVGVPARDVGPAPHPFRARRG